MKASTSSEKLDKFQQMLKRSTTKEAPAVAAKSASSSSTKRGRSLSTARVSTHRVNQEQKNISRGRGRSHSKPRKSQQAPPLTTKEKADHSSTTAPKSSHRERSKSRSSKRWSSSGAAYSRSSRSQSCRRSKTDLRTSKSAADVRAGASAADVTVGARPLPVDKSGRSRSMSRSRPDNISPAYASLYAPPHPYSPTQTNNTSQGKDAMLRRSDERTRSMVETVAPRKFLVEVDDDMNILKLKEVLADNPSRRKSRRRSSSCEPPSRSQRERGLPTSNEYRRSRRRSSSCEPPVLRPSLRSSRSRSELNQSVSFSIRNENTEDTIRRVSSYSRQLPQIVKDLVDFDPPLKKGSLKESTATSSTQDTSTINDDEEDSLAFPPESSENANDKNLQSDYMDSNLAIIASGGEDEDEDDTTNVSRSDPSLLSTVQENVSNRPPSLPETSSKQATKPTKKRGFFKRKTYRRVTNDSELQEEDPSFLNTAADCLKTQQQKQKKKEKSKSRSRRFYQILK